MCCAVWAPMNRPLDGRIAKPVVTLEKISFFQNVRSLSPDVLIIQMVGSESLFEVSGAFLLRKVVARLSRESYEKIC
jgi:hypothetical protein